MKPTTTRKKPASTPPTRGFSEVLRAGRRISPYAFMASAGIWLPRADAATLVNLDATSAANYPPGPVSTWTNTGALIGDFTNNTATLPVATNINGIECIFFDGVGGAGGASLAGPE